MNTGKRVFCAERPNSNTPTMRLFFGTPNPETP